MFIESLPDACGEVSLEFFLFLKCCFNVICRFSAELETPHHDFIVFHRQLD
jgi:hypothetical protein